MIFPFPLYIYMYRVFVEDNIWKDTSSNRFTGFNEIRRWRIKDPLTVTVGALDSSSRAIAISGS